MTSAYDSLRSSTEATGSPETSRTIAPVDRIVIAARVVFALLGFSALVTEVATLHAQHRWAAGNFFSYFTVEANTLTVISLLLSSLVMAGGVRSRGLDLYRGAVALYMTTTILIFIVLLSGYPSSELTAAPWDNTVLHYIMPIVIILDWLVVGRPAPVSFGWSASWLLFPLGYLFYSLIRGPIAHFYPYPFMNPHHHGYLGVAITSIVIAVILTAITAIVGSAPKWMPERLRTP